MIVNMDSIKAQEPIWTQICEKLQKFPFASQVSVVSVFVFVAAPVETDE